MNSCNRYWQHTDFLPIDMVVAYWCEKSGFGLMHCKEAKIGAIVSACERKKIKYGRSDGKTFDDSPQELASMGVLTVNRKSFDKWVTDNFEDESPIPKILSSTERTTLLVIIAALCVKSGISHHERGAAAQIARLTQNGEASVSEDAISKILKKLPDAIRNRMK